MNESIASYYLYPTIIYPLKQTKSSETGQNIKGIKTNTETKQKTLNKENIGFFFFFIVS